MMLADAIDSAVSEHAVYFLVTAYVESLHHFHTSFRAAGARHRSAARRYETTSWSACRSCASTMPRQ